jgi:hypothetical protein
MGHFLRYNACVAIVVKVDVIVVCAVIMMLVGLYLRDD